MIFVRVPSTQQIGRPFNDLGHPYKNQTISLERCQHVVTRLHLPISASTHATIPQKHVLIDLENLGPTKTCFDWFGKSRWWGALPGELCGCLRCIVWCPMARNLRVCCRESDVGGCEVVAWTTFKQSHCKLPASWPHFQRRPPPTQYS